MTIENENELIAWSISHLRRNIIREFAFLVVQTFGDFDYSFSQMATLLLLDEEGEQTIKGVAELLGRSFSATSRLLDQLVVRGMINRREDEHDRRVKRVAITGQGRSFIETIEQRRANVQIAVMEYLSLEERAEVVRGMVLLVEATRRKSAPTRPANDALASTFGQAGRKEKEHHESPKTGTTP